MVPKVPSAKMYDSSHVPKQILPLSSTRQTRKGQFTAAPNTVNPYRKKITTNNYYLMPNSSLKAFWTKISVRISRELTPNCQGTSQQSLTLGVSMLTSLRTRSLTRIQSLTNNSRFLRRTKQILEQCLKWAKVISMNLTFLRLKNSQTMRSRSL